MAAKAMGAETIQGDVIDFYTEDDTIRGVNLSSGDVIEAGNVVLAMGPWTSQAAAKLGCEIPFYPTMEECIRIRPKKAFPQHSLVGGVEILARVSGDVVLATADVDKDGDLDVVALSFDDGFVYLDRQATVYGNA